MPEPRTTYLDTSAWNRLLDWSSGRSVVRLVGCTILFSSCNLDEFAGASHFRAKALAALAGRISNKKKLLDHIELTAAETHARLRGEKACSAFDDDPRFLYGWKQVRTGATFIEVASALREGMHRAKKEFQSFMKLHRKLFRTKFRMYESLGLKKAWPEMLSEPDNEGFIQEHLAQNLEFAGVPDLAREVRAGEPAMYRSLPGTACWLQYYMALNFISCFEDGEVAKPDFGDQVDFRHAAYAGVADRFVTADDRMQRILTEMVPSRRSEVVTFGEFVETWG